MQHDKTFRKNREKGGKSKIARIYDTHAHINDPQFKKDVEEVVKRARERGVIRIFIPGYDIKSSLKGVELARKFGYKASCGIHPHDAKTYDSEKEKILKELLREPEITAVGEIGLDFYKMYSPREVQIDVFKRQLELAIDYKLPVILHVRDAHEEIFKILEYYRKDLKGGIFHCFSGGEDEVREALKFEDFYISFSGSITYRNSKSRKALKVVPLKRLLVETDSPYLTPSKAKGRNEPANVIYVIEIISSLLERSFEKIASITFENAIKILEGTV